MWSDGDDGYVPFAWPVTPEYAIRAGRIILGIGLENLPGRIVRIRHRIEFVGLEALVARIGTKIPQSLSDLLEQALCLGLLSLGVLPALKCLLRFGLQLGEFPLGSGRPCQVKHC